MFLYTKYGKYGSRQYISGKNDVLIVQLRYYGEFKTFS